MTNHVQRGLYLRNTTDNTAYEEATDLQVGTLEEAYACLPAACRRITTCEEFLDRYSNCVSSPQKQDIVWEDTGLPYFKKVVCRVKDAVDESGNNNTEMRFETRTKSGDSVPLGSIYLEGSPSHAPRRTQDPGYTQQSKRSRRHSTGGTYHHQRQSSRDPRTGSHAYHRPSNHRDPSSPPSGQAPRGQQQSISRKTKEYDVSRVDDVFKYLPAVMRATFDRTTLGSEIGKCERDQGRVKIWDVKFSDALEFGTYAGTISLKTHGGSILCSATTYRETPVPEVIEAETRNIYYTPPTRRSTRRQTSFPPPPTAEARQPHYDSTWKIPGQSYGSQQTPSPRTSRQASTPRQARTRGFSSSYTPDRTRPPISRTFADSSWTRPLPNRDSGWNQPPPDRDSRWNQPPPNRSRRADDPPSTWYPSAQSPFDSREWDPPSTWYPSAQSPFATPFSRGSFGIPTQYAPSTRVPVQPIPNYSTNFGIPPTYPPGRSQRSRSVPPPQSTRYKLPDLSSFYSPPTDGWF